MSKIAKAIAGAVTAVVAQLLAQWGLDVPTETITWLEQVIASGLVGLLGFAGVWISPKNTE